MRAFISVGPVAVSRFFAGARRPHMLPGGPILDVEAPHGDVVRCLVQAVDRGMMC